MAVIQGGSILKGLQSAGVVLHPDAQIFVVDPSVSGFGINEALASCVADQGDVIAVLPGSHAVTEVVDIDVRGVTIMAVNWGGNPHASGEKFTINAGSGYTDGPAVKITAPCRIIGMGIAGRQTAGESLFIDSEESGGFSGGFVELKNCRFSAWYGAMDAFIRCIGGQLTKIHGCTFDGLFGGVGTAAIVLDSDAGPIDPGFYQIEGNYFYGVGSGKHALKIATSDTAVGLELVENRLIAGFVAANQGKLADLNSTDSWGTISRNYLAPLADAAAAIENSGSWTGGIGGNYYEES